MAKRDSADVIKDLGGGGLSLIIPLGPHEKEARGLKLERRRCDKGSFSEGDSTRLC